MVATDMAGGELTQADLEASMNAAHAHLREGTPESADQARDLLEEILEARCDGAQASSMVRLQCEAKYKLAPGPAGRRPGIRGEGHIIGPM